MPHAIYNCVINLSSCTCQKVPLYNRRCHTYMNREDSVSMDVQMFSASSAIAFNETIKMNQRKKITELSATQVNE